MSGFAAADSATTQSLGDAISTEDIRNSGIKADDQVAQYATMLGDDALILAQRLGWWISRAPEMEEDIALGNIALDLIGHTRFFYTYAASAWDKTEDDLAYFRTEEEFRSARDRKSTRLNSSHVAISYAVFCLKKKNTRRTRGR